MTVHEAFMQGAVYHRDLCTMEGFVVLSIRSHPRKWGGYMLMLWQPRFNQFAMWMVGGWFPLYKDGSYTEGQVA